MGFSLISQGSIQLVRPLIYGTKSIFKNILLQNMSKFSSAFVYFNNMYFLFVFQQFTLCNRKEKKLQLKYLVKLVPSTHNSCLFSQLNENQDIKKVEHNGVKRACPFSARSQEFFFSTLMCSLKVIFNLCLQYYTAKWEVFFEDGNQRQCGQQFSSVSLYYMAAV